VLGWRNGGERQQAERWDGEAPADGTVPLRYFVGWTEQRHHLSGAVGRKLLEHMLAVARVEREAAPRALRITDAGRRALRKEFGAAALD
jgi:hypothetical protein